MKTATYNYEAFDFAMDGPGAEAWHRDSPPPGSEAPDFELADVQGRLVRLSDLRGRPVVLEFGSYTCPIFSGHIPAMEDVARRHPQATFLVVYTREAHPGEVTPPHRSIVDKRAAARVLLRDESIARTVIVDDLEGSVHSAYGGAWDALFILDPAGRIVGRRAWNDPSLVDEVLNALRANRAVEPFDSIEMSPPRTRPFGEGLLRGGERAVLDFYRTAPPPVQERFRNSPSERVRAIIAGEESLTAQRA